MSLQGIAILTLSVVLLQDTPQGRFVTQLGALTDDPSAALGITGQPGVEGDRVAVIALGTAPAEAAEAIDEGDKVTLDENGCIVVADNDDPVAGIAMQTASAAGQLIEVLIK